MNQAERREAVFAWVFLGFAGSTALMAAGLAPFLAVLAAAACLGVLNQIAVGVLKTTNKD